MPPSAPLLDAAPFWRTRPSGRAASYWQDADAPHREILIDALRLLPPWTSVLEVGCASGPNLRRIRATWPDAHVTGLDVNHEAVVFGRAMADHEEWPQSRWIVGDVRHDPLPEADVVLSCYALAYVEPELIAEVVTKMRAAARDGLVLMEPMVRRGDASEAGLIRTEPMPEWRHDYAAMGLSRWQALWPVVPAVQALNGVLITRRID